MRAPRRCAKAGCYEMQPCKKKGHQRGWTNPGPNFRPLPYNWQSLVRQVKKRDNGRCVLCGSTERLEVDHMQPRSTGGQDSVSNLRTLCKIHHDEKTREDSRLARERRKKR